jgi:hypothetical protein
MEAILPVYSSMNYKIALWHILQKNTVQFCEDSVTEAITSDIPVGLSYIRATITIFVLSTAYSEWKVRLIYQLICLFTANNIMPLRSTRSCYHSDYAYYVPCYCTAVPCSVFETRKREDKVIEKPLQKSSWNFSGMTSNQPHILGKYQLFTSTWEKKNAEHLMMWDSEPVMCSQHASHEDTWEEGIGRKGDVQVLESFYSVTIHLKRMKHLPKYVLKSSILRISPESHHVV